MKVLMLCSKEYWLHKMSRVRFHAMKAIARHPDIEGFFDGPGFDGWIDVPTSVKKYSPDVIFWFKPLEMKGHDKVNVPKVIAYNEMNHVKEVEKEIGTTKTDIVLCHLSNEIKNFSHMAKNHQFVSMPHCIEKTIFKNYELPKEYDIMLAGVIAPKIYPLRAKFYNIINSGVFSKYKVKVQKHAGYRIKDVDNQVINYAKELNKSKIVLTCSSIYKYALAKYSEIPACNSLLIADMPDERQDFFNNFMIKIEPSWPDKKIIDTIIYWIKNEKEREEKIKLGVDLTLKDYTQEHYADRFYNIVKGYLGNK